MIANRTGESEAAGHRKYHEKIDGLRAVAIGFVLIEHFGSALGHRITAGYYGVDLFFVISGFLITNILLSSRKTFLRSYRDFVGRRTLRIFPIYYLTLAVLFAVGYQPCRDSIVYLATYTFNYAWIRYQIPTGALSHFWSLAVEEQFYLFWPLFVLGLRRWPRILFAAIGVLTATSFYQLTTSHFDSIAPYNFVGLFPRAGSLCLGALGAMLHRQKRFLDEVFRNNLLEWMVVAGLAVTLVTDYGLKYLALGSCSLYLVLKSAHSSFNIRWLESFLTNRRVVKVGTVSYGIYVFHVPIGYFVTNVLVAPWWYPIDFDSWGSLSFLREGLWVVLLPVLSAISYAFASLSSRYIEKPVLALKDRWFP
jgi:peptidoglycan/LPS O-acetylase OafA/YrhL